ncbi:MAG TPA: ATP-binding protein [Candidatus Saccharimonadia bacterium]|jgi:PAS domain S-box-containing protein
MRYDRFKSQVLALFFVVSIVPALVVGAVWYFYIQTSSTNFLFLDFKTFVLPVILIGLIPALFLSFLFAELLVKPVRRIREAALELARGNFKAQFKRGGAWEFEDIGTALDNVAARLAQTVSQAASEQALIAAERNKLRSVLDAMTDGVFALDRSGRIILFNKAASELTGRDISEVAGQLSEKVLPFRAAGQLVMTRWLATHAGTEHKIGEWKGLELYTAGGGSLYVDVQAKVLNDDPNGIAALVTFHDLTKSRQLEEMKIDFVALAAHELRTPLTEIRGYLDILQHEAKGLSKTNRDFITRAMISSNQLGGLMHNLLNVSRIEHGELGFKPVETDYIQFTKDILKELSDRAKSQNRQLHFKAPLRLPLVMVDPTSLREVIVNLVDNAINHTEPGVGEITLTIEHRNHEIETTVTDNGFGIPAAAIPHLFTKFFRVGEMKSATRGTGLGLYICKAIVEAHGGHIWVESEEGQGSTFAFRLPTRTIAHGRHADDNDHISSITRGAHGWIKKDHPVH